MAKKKSKINNARKLTNKVFKKRSGKTGLPAGTLVHVGTQRSEEVGIELFAYNEKECFHKKLYSIKDYLEYKDNYVCWINLEGVHRTDIIKDIGTYFCPDMLILEDILNTDQRPKIELYDDYVVIILKMISFNDKLEEIDVEQVSLVFGENFVVSIQEGKEGDVFNPVRERLKANSTNLRKYRADYLTYSLLDTIVDNYFVVLEKIGEKTDYLDAVMLTNPQTNILQQTYGLKRELIFLRKALWPLREVVYILEKSNNPIIHPDTRIYFDDVYEHTVQVIDTVETFRDIIAGMIELNISLNSNRMNEVMKVLTVIGTIFIPLTFITSLYGMNFEYMPELKSKLGYPSVLTVMLILSIIMIYYFRRKQWI